MPNESFEENLLRLIGAELFLSLAMNAARDIFGKGYFALQLHEREAVEGTVRKAVAAGYGSLTPDLLKEELQQQAAKFKRPQNRQDR
jgi:hypothetical protein